MTIDAFDDGIPKVTREDLISDLQEEGILEKPEEEKPEEKSGGEGAEQKKEEDQAGGDGAPDASKEAADAKDGEGASEESDPAKAGEKNTDPLEALRKEVADVRRENEELRRRNSNPSGQEKPEKKEKEKPSIDREAFREKFMTDPIGALEEVAPLLGFVKSDQIAPLNESMEMVLQEQILREDAAVISQYPELKDVAHLIAAGKLPSGNKAVEILKEEIGKRPHLIRLSDQGQLSNAELVDMVMPHVRVRLAADKTPSPSGEKKPVVSAKVSEAERIAAQTSSGKKSVQSGGVELEKFVGLSLEQQRDELIKEMSVR